MQTRMTELFGIKYPIMLSGMNWLTTPPIMVETDWHKPSGKSGSLLTNPSG